MDAMDRLQSHRRTALDDDDGDEKDDGAGEGSTLLATPSPRRPTARGVGGGASFLTVDWMNDADVARRHREAVQDQQLFGACLSSFDAAQAWLVLALVGFAAAAVCGGIDFSEEWVFGLKSGFCAKGFFFSRAVCCMELPTSDMTDCASWVTWGEWMTGDDESQGLVGVGVETIDMLVYLAMACALAGSAAFVVANSARLAAGSGIPEVKVILGGFTMPGFLSLRSLLAKSVGLVLAVGSGLSLGKEGPFVHVACCCGELISERFPKYAANEGKRREIMSASVAAGVAVAFGAPIGGVLFSLEEASTYFSQKTLWRSFLCAVIAALTLQVMNPQHSGKFVLFEVNYHHAWHWFELPVFVLLGVLGGLLGSLLVYLNLQWCAMKRGMIELEDRGGSSMPTLMRAVHGAARFLGRRPVVDAAATALLTGVICYEDPFLRNSAPQFLGVLFSECDTGEGVEAAFYTLCGFEEKAAAGDGGAFLAHVSGTAWHLLYAALVRVLLTALTFGLVLPAGVFIPALTSGACLGRAAGLLMKGIARNSWPMMPLAQLCQASGHHCITPGIYAMVGAAAMLGGVTRMTISLVVIMLELTGGLGYVLPIMVAVIVSKWVGDAIHKHGIYDAHIELNGYPYLGPAPESGSARASSGPQTAADVMTAMPLQTISSDTTVDELEQMLRSSPLKGWPVVVSQDRPHLVGYLCRRSLKEAWAQRGLRKCAADTSCTFAPELALSSSRRDRGRERRHGRESEQQLIDLSPWMDKMPMQLVASTSMVRCIDVFRALGLRYALITRNGELVGLIKKKDLLTSDA